MQLPHVSNHWIKVVPVIIMVTPFVLFIDAPIGWDFRNNLWGPAYLLTQGKSAYDIDLLFDIGNALWMPMSIGLFFPLGFIPLQQASNLWWVLNLFGGSLLIWLVVRPYRRAFPLLAASIAAGLFFPPSIAHFWLGQMTFLIALAFIVIVFFSDSIPDPLSALLLAVALAKPQLGLMVLPGLMIMKYRSGGFKNTIRYIVFLAVSILFLTIPLYISNASWLSDFCLQLGRNPDWQHPSSLTVFRTLLPDFGVFLWLAIAAAGMWCNLRSWLRLPPSEALLWSLAITSAVTPYIWTWDFVLILPLFFSRVHQFRSRKAQAVLLGGYLVSCAAMVGIRLEGLSEYSMWWVPWFYLFIILVGGFLEKQPLQNKLRKNHF